MLFVVLLFVFPALENDFLGLIEMFLLELLAMCFEPGKNSHLKM